MVTAYWPDIIVHNTDTCTVALLELTCPLDSDHHLESARYHKQNKVEYQQMLAELGWLEFPNYYEILEVSDQCFSVKNVLNLLHFIHLDVSIPRATVQQMCSKEMCFSFLASIYGLEM